jgi:hypothetical protein
VAGTPWQVTGSGGSSSSQGPTESPCCSMCL